MRPINIGGFVLHETGVTVEGRPTFAHYEAAMAFAHRANKASGWWLADLLRYGDGREDWAERLSQAQHLTGLSEKRLKNIRAVAAIPVSRRRDGVEMELHAEVAGCEPDEQEYWLARTEKENWSRNDLRLHMRGAKRRKVIEGQAVLEGQFRIWMADPPWRYGDSGVISGSAYGRAEAHYETMTIEEISKVPVQAHCTPNATLFLWVPVPMLLERPGPADVIEAWGFTYKSEKVWDKGRGMPGNYAMQITHECLLICARGDGKPDEPTPHDDSIFAERSSGQHSEKPNRTVMSWIEKHWTTGPYVSLFASEQVEGFDAWRYLGNDARLWPAQTAEAV